MSRILITGLILLGLILALVIGSAGADLISSSVLTDGSAWIDSSLTRGEDQYFGRFFTADPASIVREVKWDGPVLTRTSIQSSGSLGVDEVSSRLHDPGSIQSWCLLAPEPEEGGSEEVRTSALMRSAIYTAARRLGADQTDSWVDLNGSGMVSLKKRSEKGNSDQEERTFTAGKMHLHEYLLFGGDSGWKF